MRRIGIVGLAAMAILGMPLRAQDGLLSEKAEAAGTPGQQIEALSAEFQKARSGFFAAYDQARTDEERLKLQREKFPDTAPYVARMFALAEANPYDPATVEALIFCVRRGGGTPAGVHAIARLAERFAGDPRVSQVIEVLPRLAPASETLLRAVAEKSGDRRTRGLATLMLGRLLNARAEDLRNLRDEPARFQWIKSRMMEQGMDEAAFQRFQDTDPEAVTREAEATFERILKDFGDVEYMAATLGKAAEGELYELRNLRIGMRCPDIAGEDIDGKGFKLGDFHGKVVLVVFCGDWCAPCRGLYPHERSLVKSMEGRPFVLVGVNSDRVKDTPRKLMEEGQITWRSWWDGGGAFGPIATQFNVRGWPTIYVIDHKGLIRHKWFGAPITPECDAAIEALVREAEKDHPDAARDAGR
jgi:peroxiredoxin